MDDWQASLDDRLHGRADHRTAGYGKDQTGARELRGQDPPCDLFRLHLFGEAAVYDHQRIEGVGNSFERLGKPPIEGRLGADQQHFDAQQSSMGVGKRARVVQCARGNDHLLDQFRANTSAPVQDTLDRCGPYARTAGDVAITRFAHFPAPSDGLTRPWSIPCACPLLIHVSPQASQRYAGKSKAGANEDWPREIWSRDMSGLRHSPEIADADGEISLGRRQPFFSSSRGVCRNCCEDCHASR